MLYRRHVHSVSKSGSALITGDATFSEGANVTLTQIGNNIEIASTGGGGGGAPTNAQYVTLATDATLTNERVLTGTTNQVVITDNGAGSTVVLSLPQSIHTGASPTFAGLTLSGLGLGIVHSSAGGVFSSSLVVNADIAAGAAIDFSKLAALTSGNVLYGVVNVATSTALNTIAVTALTGTANQITVSASVGSVTLSTPQNIHTAATPTFAGMTLSGLSVAGIVHNSAAGLLSTSLIVNADVSASAAIAYSKLNLTGSIVNADISASAAIAYSKLNLATSIVNADVSASAAIAYSKLNLSGSIVNADISTSAAIAFSKLAALTSGNVIYGVTNVATSTALNTIAVTALTGTSNQVNVSASVGSVTLSTPQNIHTGASPTFAGLTLSGLTSTGVLYNASGVITTEAAFTYDATNNILFVPEIAGGSTTSSSLMVSAYSNTFADTNTGRIQFMERMVFDQSWTATGSGGVLSDVLLKFTGTLTTGLAINILPSVQDTRTVRYSASQTVSAFWTFSAGTIYQPTTAVTDGAAYTQFAGFVSRPQYAPDIAAGTATTDLLIGFAAGPLTRRVNAGTVALTNLIGFGTYVTPLILANDLENATVTNLYHFKATNPFTSGLTLTNNFGLYVPALANGTNRYGYYSDVAAGATQWSIYSNGDAQSAHKGLFKIGDMVAPTALLHTIGSTTARASIRVEAGTAPTTPNSGDLWHDSTRMCFQVYCGGMTQGLQKVIYTQTATQTIGGTATETTLFGTGVGSNTLPANFLNIGKTLRCKIWGHYSTKAAPVGSLDIRIKLGSTTLLTLTGTLTASLTSEAFFVEAIITCRTTGATGTVFTQGWTNLGETAGTPFTFYVANTATSTINTTASQAFDITWDWTTSNASNTVSATNAITEMAF